MNVMQKLKKEITTVLNLHGRKARVKYWLTHICPLCDEYGRCGICPAHSSALIYPCKEAIMAFCAYSDEKIELKELRSILNKQYKITLNKYKSMQAKK